ncbi:cyclic nucleotide-binding domain-containing protein [Roseospira goensis]|uniref:CRP/FNR family transcriptional regulator n=1 Tax=Roseospira goensis TaxID=391922 RepID=A0A7W6WKU1_9PROT|nr:cyclic nucleotide-binding domain-containing protein [Roseospira goensis]MBB4286018.1 CRP/FNR family transcriptional regulator [Roseospira goensis]
MTRSTVTALRHDPVCDGTTGGVGPATPAESQGPCGQCDLGTLAFCDGFAARTISSLSRVQCTLRFEPHDTLFREGDQGLAVYSVVSGAVKVYKLMPDGRRQITGFFFRGDMFGFCLDGTYAYTAEAITPVGVCRLPMQRLGELAETAPEIQYRIVLRMTAKLAQFHDHVLLLGRKTARERVATFLLTLSDRARRRGDPPSPLSLPMGRADIADHIGLTVETVSRAMTWFKREGLLDLPSPSQVAIRQPEALRAIADGAG